MLQKGKLLTSATVTIITKILAAKNRSYLHFATVAEDQFGTFQMDSTWCCALVRHQVNLCSYLYIVPYNQVYSKKFIQISSSHFIFQFSSNKKVSFNIFYLTGSFSGILFSAFSEYFSSLISLLLSNRKAVDTLRGVFERIHARWLYRPLSGFEYDQLP